MPADILHADHSPRFASVFAWYLRRKLAGAFHTVRITHGSRAALGALEQHPGAAMVLFTHSAWWDPLMGLYITRTLIPSRRVLAPMDVRQLRRFPFFRKLGLFGIDPDNPASLAAMCGYVSDEFARVPRSLIALTPQGTFADPRAPIVLRPGAAALGARFATRNLRVAVVAAEYVFWTDQKPELLIAAELIAAPSMRGDSAHPPTITDLHRTYTHAMRACASRLAASVIARDEAAFEIVLGAANGAARVNPAYDLWQRLRGRGESIPPSGQREPVA
ncbi:MAG: hypothetical protein ACKVS8_06830 [Phycisphaerales bacterium]